MRAQLVCLCTQSYCDGHNIEVPMLFVNNNITYQENPHTHHQICFLCSYLDETRTSSVHSISKDKQQLP